MKIFKTEPRKGICFSGHHKMSTVELIQKFANPTLISSFDEIPCAKTVQGMTPAFEEMRMAYTGLDAVQREINYEKDF